MEALLGGAPARAKVALKPPGMAGHVMRREVSWDNVVEMSDIVHRNVQTFKLYLQRLLQEPGALVPPWKRVPLVFRRGKLEAA